MPMVSIRCESCGRTLKADARHAGLVAPCPNCQAKVVIPSAQQADERPPVAEMPSVPESAPQPGRAAASTQPRSMSIRDLRDRREALAKGVLTILAIPVWIVLLLWIVISLGLPLIIIGIVVVARYLANLFSLAYIKAFAVRTSPRQFPEIHEAAIKASQKLDIDPPEVYVMQDNVWNSFATKLAGKRVVVLLSGAVDAVLLKGAVLQLK